MGQYAAHFIVPDDKAIGKQTNPSKSNWITAHAIASELSIAEVERLWVRFKQLGADTKEGVITEAILKASPVQNDVFMRNILVKFMSGSTKKITFENFLKGLKWCEQADLEHKVRGIFHLLNNGSPVKKELMQKILERVYPGDKVQDITRINDMFFQIMDTEKKGQVTEDQFANAVLKIPQGVLKQILDFQVLPDEMKERLHKNLLEFRTDTGMATGATPRGLTPGRGKQIAPDSALKAVTEKIHKKDWEKVANKLGFFSDDIEEIRDAYPSNTQQQAYQMLRQWKDRDGSMAMLEVLEKALLDCGMRDAALVLSSY
ncbi:hypothetical protein ACJMK2_034124 [Sinanodonta woodiana]|uniref:Death domain-containing protein n=1 Tax=Sinanodonta woodiana TaxID=1069815 RepID=A0ABD3WS07_SINWO